MSESAILQVQNLTKTYLSGERSLTVVKDVSFHVEEGKTCSIIGPSGSGKTTLLGLCAGLDRSSSGSVTLNHIPLDELDEDQRAHIRNQFVGFVFQNFARAAPRPEAARRARRGRNFCFRHTCGFDDVSSIPILLFAVSWSTGLQSHFNFNEPVPADQI